MQIALVHDWLNNLGGAERVLIELHKIFPKAKIYTLFINKKFVKDFLPEAKIETSYIQKIPFIDKIYPKLFFLMPTAVESFDFSEYDLVISSSVMFSKGLILKPQIKHICYCYSPTRQLWDLNAQYSQQIKKYGWLATIAQHFLRIWDRQSADRVDEFIAISNHVKKRIKKYYRKEAKVIYPPLTIIGELNGTNKEYYLMISRLFPHKNIDIAIDAFNKLGYPLVIIGDGPEKLKLKRMAEKNIKLLGYKDDETVKKYYKHCKAFIMPQEEDFGLTPLEAMSFGKPVLALRKGGAMETMIEGITGEFFNDPIPESLADGIRRLENNYSNYDPKTIQAHTQKFSKEKFRKEILKLIKAV